MIVLETPLAGFSAYKPGQGYWTRVISAVGAGTLVLAGIAWLLRSMEAWDIWKIEAPASITVKVQNPEDFSDPASAVASFGITQTKPYLRGGPVALAAGQDPWELSQGVVVSQIRPGSDAARMGLQIKQVITGVGDQPVKNPDELADALVKADWTQGAILKVIRFNDILLYAQGGAAVLIIAISGGLLWYLLNQPRIADFLIATEVEMRKVSWPGRRELVGSTWIVICGTLMIVALLFVVNIGFAMLFRKIGILAGAP